MWEFWRVSIVSTALGLGGFQVSNVCQISVLRNAFHKTGKNSSVELSWVGLVGLRTLGFKGTGLPVVRTSPPYFDLEATSASRKKQIRPAHSKLLQIKRGQGLGV